MTTAQITKSVEVLRETLATLFVAGVHVRNCHWCVTGVPFLVLHELFGKQYEVIDASVDKIAERVRALGYNPLPQTIAQVVKLSELKDSESPFRGAMEAKAALAYLIAENEIVIDCLREYIEELEGAEDCASAQILIDMLIHHEHQQYLMKSSL